MSGWSNELESLEKVMRVYDELGGDAEEEIHDLVTVSRHFLLETDFFVKEAPFTTSKKEKHHMYLFNDLMVIGRPVTAKDRKYKVTHFIILKQCTFKESPKPDADGQFLVTLTQVSRHRVYPDGSLADAHDTSARIVTRIEKLELTFPQEKTKQEVMKDIHTHLDEIEKEENARRESAAAIDEASSSGDTPKKQRSWAKKRATLTKSAKNVLGHDDDTASVSESISGLSLSDVEARYSVDFQTPAASEKKESVEFEICFGEGPMGFSLGSGAGVGVLVGRLAPGSFAEMGGVCIGDRILAVDHEPVSLNTSWQDCVEKLKKLPRPLTITFERTAARQVDPEHEHHHEHHDEEKDKPGELKSTPSTGSVGGEEAKKRNWANRRAQRAANAGGAGGMISLNELEKVYKSSQAAKTGDAESLQIFETLHTDSAAEKSAAAVLKEILVTERDYVDDLRALVGEYIIPLRRALRRGKCKEIENGSKICEHNLIRSTCNRTSSEAQPILDAESMKAIFCNTETLMTVNTELLSQLQNGLNKVYATNKKPHLKDIASVYAPAFLHIVPFFKMYAVYCHNYSTAVQRLLECRTMNPELHDFLQNKEQKSEFTSLSSLLIKPVQRICKYPLLFGELLKQLGQCGTGVQGSIGDLKKTSLEVERVAHSVNQQVGESEAMEKIVEAYEELGGDKGAPGLVQAHRRFVRSDDVWLHEPATDKDGELKDRILYMFNDLLIIAKATNASGGTLHKLSSHSLSERPKSLLRALSGTASKGTLPHTNSKHKLRQQVAKVEHWLEAESLTPTPVEWKHSGEKKFGVSLKHIGRKTEEVRKHGTLTRHKSSSTQSSGKIITVVEKFEIWFDVQADRDSFFEELTKHKEKQTGLAEGQKKAESEFGTPKTQRSWTRKGGRHNSSLGHHGRTNSGTALSEIEGKYSKG